MTSIIPRGLAAVFAAMLLHACMPSLLASSQLAPGRLVPSVLAGAGKDDLLYVSDGAYIYVYTWPATEFVARLNEESGSLGVCADRSGNVFATNYQAASVTEYAHGGNLPIATLSDPTGRPIGCSVDPLTGNLAVANYAGATKSETGSVTVYIGAAGTGRVYRYPQIFFYFDCAYGPNGTLFVDGQSAGFAPVLAELQPGRQQFRGVDLPRALRKVPLMGGLQWDGKYLVVGDVDNNRVYRLLVSQSKAQISGSTALGGAMRIYQFFIDGRRLIGADWGNSDVAIWRYPAGGTPLKTISLGYGVFGATVSKGP
ncbi:MAG TPA: hypothetical protein VGI19_16015 [Candidatus Cybelea sp.]